MTRLRLIASGVAERFRSSLFFVPALYVIAFFFGAQGATWVDSNREAWLKDVPLVLEATTSSAQQILSAITGATITVAGVVFSITAVAVQLASTQFSPRVLRGFLRDRVQQHTMGFIIGTFTFSVFALVQTFDGTAGGGTGAANAQPNLSVTIAVALALGVTLAIIAGIDHTMRSMQAGEIIRRVSMETHGRLNTLLAEHDIDDDVTDTATREPDGPTHTVRSHQYGWVQQIDHAALMRRLPPGTSARVEVRPGSFILRGAPMVTLWPPPDDHERVDERTRQIIEVGPMRTMQQDVAFGIRQIVDVSLRAISPSTNDPTTCVEGIVQLGGIVRDLLFHDPLDRSLYDDEGRAVFRPREPDPSNYVGMAFDEIRFYGAEQPPIAIALVTVIGEVVDQLEEAGLNDRADVLRRQGELVIEAAARADWQEADHERLFERARMAGLR